VLALGAAQLARRPASARMTFGLDRAEPLGAFVNGLALLVAVVVIVVEALRRLTGDPAPVDGWPVLWVGLVGLGINLGSAWALWRSAPDNLNVRGALAHMLADAAGSVGAVAAAGLLLLGVQGADAAVSLFIAALVAWGAWQVTRDASRVLLQLPPPGLDMDALLRGLATLEGVADVHDVHVWTLDGRHPILTAHLVPGDGTDPGELTRRATDAVEHAFGVRHATFQIDPGTSVPCPTAHCGARAPAI
ncbi:MAG: cation transporter, partial [Myxococcales bacterium]|nr:cation transporter [Myxococcales bacterium]